MKPERLSLPLVAPDAAPAACGSCALNNDAGLKRLGVDTAGWDHVVALAGNPNTGKSTVFNALTGLHQRVGNWPGTTVVRAEGGFTVSDRTFKVVDLPGTYSLLSSSRDEDVARDFLLFGDPDVTVVVVDATRLERNLNLVLQVLQVTSRVVVALNLMDEARRHGHEIDVRHLARELGVPIVPMAARRGEGLSELLVRIAEVASGARPPRSPRAQRLVPAVAEAVDELAARISAEFPGLANAHWVALRLLEGDRGTEAAVREGALGQLARQHSARASA